MILKLPGCDVETVSLVPYLTDLQIKQCSVFNFVNRRNIEIKILLILGQKCISPWAYIRERFSGREMQNLKKFAYKPMGLYAGE